MRRFVTLPLLAAALLVQTSAHSAAAAAPEVVVFVGGLGSTPLSTAANFAPLIGALVPRGVGVRTFDYGGASSCQSIEASTATLAQYLGGLRDRGEASRVILVGHSNGGVVSLGVLASSPDLAPFVERVVTVDSPLEGIKYADAVTYGARFGACPAGDELYARSQTPTWPDYLEQLAAWERGLGTDVRVVANPRDLAVSMDEQTLAAEAPYVLEATDPADWTNHAAALRAPSAADLAAIVAGA